MRIIQEPFKVDQTIKLVKLSILHNIPIVVTRYNRRDYLKQRAQELGLEMPEPIILHSIEDAKNLLEDAVYIDELDTLIQGIFAPHVAGATMTKEEQDDITHTL